LSTQSSRSAVIDSAAAWFDSGAFLHELDRRVGIRTESQESTRGAELHAYLDDEMIPTLRRSASPRASSRIRSPASARS
jgi:hypothetical protein